jgi:O-acetyl-ADP-ribose deacetylase (regulator of RNase III)
MPLDLDGYRCLARLDEPFKAPDPAPEKKADREALVDELLAYLRSESTFSPGVAEVNGMPSSYQEKRRTLRALLTVREPNPLPSEVHAQLDRLLQRETLERRLAHASDLSRIAQAFPGSSYGAGNQGALWRGDITTLRVDAIVNAANAKMLGCFQPFHTCIDNAIHSTAGPRLREDCHAIIQRQGRPEGTGWAKLTRAYNLPAKYILHTVGPIVVNGESRVLPEHEQQLSDCYHSCLDLSKRVSTIRSIAFCCISTGVFGFPQELAARIALQAVEQWLSSNSDSLELVVFNVFREDDFEIYEKLLKGK